MEELRTHRTGYRRTGRLVVVDRREARLVRAYRLFLADQSLTARRFFCPSGISDMYLETAEGGEVIEAKSEAGHRHVRQALAQLLDYAPYSPSTVHRLTALFPEAPDRDDMRFLHRYGVDCVHREPAGGFVRTPRPRAATGAHAPPLVGRILTRLPVREAGAVVHRPKRDDSGAPRRQGIAFIKSGRPDTFHLSET